MALPSNGQLSFSNINTELELSSSATLTATTIMDSTLANSQSTTKRLKYTNIVYFKQYYYALDTADGLLRRSADLVSWEPVLGFSQSSGFSTLVATSSNIYAVKYGTTSVYYSTDGTSWYNASIIVGVEVCYAQTAVAYGNTLVLLVKTTGNVYAIASLVDGSSEFTANFGTGSTLSATSRNVAIKSLSYNGVEGQIAFGTPDDPGYLIRIHSFTTNLGISPLQYEIGNVSGPDLSLVTIKWVAGSVNRFTCSFVDRQYSFTSYLISAASGGGNLNYPRSYALQLQLADSVLTLEECFLNIPGNPRYILLDRDPAAYGGVYTTNLVAGLSLITTDSSIYKFDIANNVLICMRDRVGGGSEFWYSATSDTDVIQKISSVTTGTSLSLSKLYGRSNTLFLTHSTTSNKLDLRTWALANGWDGTRPLNITNSGNIVSDSTVTPALTVTGAFPKGVTLTNTGSITGKGGNGGNGGGGTTTPPGTYPTAGSAGGTALSVSVPCFIDNTGTIQGGGGGGGGGRGATAHSSFPTTLYALGGGGGGGGASSTTYNSAGGSGGIGSSPTVYYSGIAGTASTGSTPGTGGVGGARTSYYGSSGGGGGAHGTTGAAGSPTNNSYSGSGTWPAAGAGGSGGNAVQGNANITWIATGTRLGVIT